MLDSVISSLKSRFSSKSLKIVAAIDKFFSLDFDGAAVFINHYANLLKIDKSTLKFEMKVIKNNFTVQKSEKIYNFYSLNAKTFPDFFSLYNCSQIILVSPSTCEQSFSALCRIKTYLRTYMTQNRFDNLSVNSIENDVKVGFTVIIDQFCTKNRRIIIN